jgi:TonB family protein
MKIAAISAFAAMFSLSSLATASDQKQPCAQEQTAPASAPVSGQHTFTVCPPKNAVLPPYPQQALERGTHGVVRVFITANEKGEKTEVKIAASPDSQLSSAVLDAVRKWRFQPIDANGQTVSITWVYSFTFSLNPTNVAVQKGG